MHGAVYANIAINHADLVIAMGVRFDDRVTGKLSEFCKNAKFIHIDIDPTEINKNIVVDVPIQGDVKQALKILDKYVEPKKISNPGSKRLMNGKKNFLYPLRTSKVKLFLNLLSIILIIFLTKMQSFR